MSIFSLSSSISSSYSATSTLSPPPISHHSAASTLHTKCSFIVPLCKIKNPFLKLEQQHHSKLFSVSRRGGRRPKGNVVVMSMEAGIGVMGTKLGMMSYFQPDGEVVPVTVVGFREGNIVTQIKTEATDGYSAVQVGYQRVRDRKLTKPELGHLEKVGAIPMRHLQEFRLQIVEGFEPNQRLVLEEIFQEGDLVDVAGTTIGKGFQGGMDATMKLIFVFQCIQLTANYSVS